MLPRKLRAGCSASAEPPAAAEAAAPAGAAAAEQTAAAATEQASAQDQDDKELTDLGDAPAEAGVEYTDHELTAFDEGT